MGNDGGSIPDRRDLVKSKKKAEQADKANQTRAVWFFCALSKRPLQEPIVSCALGKLYNKDAIIEHLLDKTAYGDAAKICGHIRSLKDIKVLKLTQISPPPPPDSSADVAKFVCPLTFKEMNGGQPFVYILTCGCVFSQSGLRTVLGSSPSNGNTTADEQLEVCPQCATKFSRSSDIFMINPPLEEEERMYATMELRRSLEPVKKSKKRKAGADAVADEVGTKKKKASPEGHSPSPAPGSNPKISAASRSLAQSLAVEEAKRKAGMSDAVKSLYRDKNDAPRKETFMTMGTFTRYA
ncbi:Rtf2 RING-finger-domain-containing protein [Suillus fuscotomentosus]|uniref:Rtf2 RING-finger-domain-containing protein n=1 Tax=Suillus fuscotomentosus TaxID=1912939 RepID=A0AAD4HUT9_9AGAM|nr:Rtf2 RING-finger-domain-containing protein [Suillus fuscotomentosus]KAG1908816.1 Rtf2 RING-finger-domain-containing protein [Suillus fuscotomentosus]